MEQPVSLGLKAIQHVGIPVTNLRVSEAFYSGLGFQKVMEATFEHEGENGTCMMMRQGAILMELYEMPAGARKEIASRKDGHIDHIAFDVEDVDAVFKTLTKAGYREWQLIQSNLKKAIFSSTSSKKPRIVMQYSPNNDIPYIARVDAGTVEMVRSLGVTVDSSADLVQQFEAVWTPEQLALHTEAAVKMQKVMLETFADIKRRINENIPTTETDVQQFIGKRYGELGLNPSPGIDRKSVV